MSSIGSINNIDKLIQNVVASFQIDHIEVTTDVVMKSREKIIDQNKKDSSFCKKLVKENRRVYDK